jgi:hypothetical protein
MENKLHRLEERLKIIEGAASRLRVAHSSDRETWTQDTRDLPRETVSRLRRFRTVVGGGPR